MPPIQTKNQIMKATSHTRAKITLPSSLALALTLTAWLPGAARAADGERLAHPTLEMRQIATQAQAEALKPGDSIAMTCAMCKIVTVVPVTADEKHVKMLTVGETMKCPSCKGAVEIAATGKGEGQDAEVKYVCSECGDKAMFVTATKPGSGSLAGDDKMIE